MNAPLTRSRRTLLAHLSAILCLGACAFSATALGPHEILLLVNRACYDSLTLANHYIALRGIPASHVLFIDLPEGGSGEDVEMTPDQFTRSIWDPAQAALRERDLSEQILAWVFSAGFPVRITTDPPMSIQGLIFFGNTPPDAESIEKGLAASPLFRGPVSPGAPLGLPLSLESFRAALEERMPIASMTLAHTGVRGMSRAEAVSLLQRSAQADGTHPEGVVYFIVSEDIRSQAREWQFEGAVQELMSLGVPAITTPLFPRDAKDVAGLMMGAAQAHPRHIGAYLPGAMADHLTSWAATFDRPGQTKTTAWLQAGAYSSAGTVCEPFSIWTKFPSARFFAHYARGCTLLESHVQALASPVQLLLLGDPLTAPWKPPMEMEIQELPGSSDSERLYRAQPSFGARADFIFFLNDSRITPLLREPVIRMDPVPPGSHTLRAVAYAQGPIRHQGFAVIEIEQPVPGRRVRLHPPDPEQAVSRSTPFLLLVEAEGAPIRIRIQAQGRDVAHLENTPRAEITLEPALLGAGPISFRAFAEYADEMVLRSPPLLVSIQDEPDEAPTP